MTTPPKPALLLVDDDADILSSLQTLLKYALKDVKVVTAPSGEEALRILERTHVDLIVSDYSMPGMNGIEFLNRARDLRPDVTRLMITAFPDPAIAARAVEEAGVALMIAKPFDLDYFVSVIGSLLHADGPARPKP